MDERDAKAELGLEHEPSASHHSQQQDLTSDLTVIINGSGPSPHLEAQENYAELMLSSQIFPAPKYEPSDKQYIS